MPDIIITHGLADEHREQAAALYYQAFQQKLGPIFRSDEKALDVLRASLDPNYAIVALHGGNLAGLAGFKDGNGNFVDIQPEVMTHTFGWPGGWVRLLGLALFYRGFTDGVLLMDGIVVDAAMRGKGTGTLLLDAIIQYAADNGYAHVRLDVVDTNPRARQLYERKGFVAVEEQTYPLTKRFFGFSGSTTMLRQVQSSGTVDDI
ncbi:MAG: GNAT family N-acetyltransferase [Chloroflexota bacterium]